MGAIVMYLVGLIDDIYDLKPILKLIGQIVAFNRSILWNYNRFYFVSYGPDNSFWNIKYTDYHYLDCGDN